MFFAQKIANYFPAESRIRKDRSSLGQRFFSVFSDYLAFDLAERQKVKTLYGLENISVGKPFFWSIKLEGDDVLPHSITKGGVPVWTYPSLIEGIDAIDGTLSLDRVENPEDLFWGLPTRFRTSDLGTYGNATVWQSSVPHVYNAITYYDQLLVQVVGSTDYFKRTPLTNRSASGVHEIIISGKDYNYQDFQERILVDDDGYYRMRNVVRTVTDVQYTGFDGSVNIYLAHVQTETQDYWALGASSLVEGNLFMSWENLDPSPMHLTYFTKPIKNGTNYLTGQEEPVDNIEGLWCQTLLDDSGTAYIGVDLAIDPNSLRLYTVDSSGTIHLYERGPTVFAPPDEEPTSEIFLDLEATCSCGKLGQEVNFYTFLAKPRLKIISAVIKRVSPSAVTTYLQADGSWGVASYSFDGANDPALLPEQDWTDIHFVSTLSEYGQWDFYVESTTSEGVNRCHMAVMADAKNSLLDFDTGITAPVAMWFDRAGELLIANATNVYKITRFRDYYLVNETQQEIFLSESYTAVEVTP